MTRLVVIDGVIQTPEHAVISVYDRGFLYGDSVFETVRTYSGKLYALDQHLQRLQVFLESQSPTLRQGVPAYGSAILELFVKIDISGILELAKVGAEISVRLIEQFLETGKGQSIRIRQKHTSSQPTPVLEQFVEILERLTHRTISSSRR